MGSSSGLSNAVNPHLDDNTAALCVALCKAQAQWLVNIDLCAQD